jgi:hypothetical protein
MKNTKTNGAAKTANTTSNQECQIEGRWLRRMEQNALGMKGLRASDIPLGRFIIDRDVAQRAEAAARRLAKRTGVKVWQAKSAIYQTGFQMMLADKSRWAGVQA